MARITTDAHRKAGASGTADRGGLAILIIAIVIIVFVAVSFGSELGGVLKGLLRS